MSFEIEEDDLTLAFIENVTKIYDSPLTPFISNPIWNFKSREDFKQFVIKQCERDAEFHFAFQNADYEQVEFNITIIDNEIVVEMAEIQQTSSASPRERLKALKFHTSVTELALSLTVIDES